MCVTQEDKVVEARFSAVRPVHEVMRLQPSLALATGEPTTLISVAKDPSDLASHDAPPAADPNRTTA